MKRDAAPSRGRLPPPPSFSILASCRAGSTIRSSSRPARATVCMMRFCGSVAVSVAFASAAEIDRINIRQATFLAMRRALFALSAAPNYVLIDGNDLPPDLRCPAETIVKGDALIASIAAASIIAKVTRDRLMRRLCASLSRLSFQPAFWLWHAKPISRRSPSMGRARFHRLSFRPFEEA